MKHSLGAARLHAPVSTIGGSVLPLALAGRTMPTETGAQVSAPPRSSPRDTTLRTGGIRVLGA